MMNASDALFGFVAWLTTRDEKTVMCSSVDCVHVVDLMQQFIKANDLGNVTELYPQNIVFPKE